MTCLEIFGIFEIATISLIAFIIWLARRRPQNGVAQRVITELVRFALTGESAWYRNGASKVAPAMSTHRVEADV